MRLFPILTLTLVLLAGCATTPPLTAAQPVQAVAWAGSTPVARGQAFVELNCAGCHAVGPTGESPVSPAPPFRTLSQRYPVRFLEEAFAEGISNGHTKMPEFQLAPDQIADLMAYLESLSPPAKNG